MIEESKFLEIISNTPLVSIDLIIENSKRHILLGKRVNRPAKGYWFVPGGRIQKNEKISDAIRRISRVELGVEIAISEAELYGTYDHIYEDNCFGREGINTHYVVLAYRARLNDGQRITPDCQHASIEWWEQDALLSSDDVHENTKRYFQ